MSYLYRKQKLFIFLLVFLMLAGGVYFLYCSDRTKNFNVLLITIDALRPDHLGCYGYKRNTSPNMDKLAKEGVLFTQAITAAGWTCESLPSILTGTYPFIHGVKGWHWPLNPSIETLPQLLNLKGVNSALFSNHLPITYMDIKDSFGLIYVTGWKEVDDHLLTSTVINWLKRNKDKPFFAYIHYEGAHGPYRPPEPYKSKYLYDKFRVKKETPFSTDKAKLHKEKTKIPYYVAENNISDIGYYVAQYDGEISYTDTQIGRLIESLKKLRLLEKTLIILSADHGEMLGEHDIYFAHQSCYENNIRVPLIISCPRLFPKAKIIPQQVSLIDIAPTILEILKINIPPYIQGKSLLELLKRDKLSLHPYVYTSDPIIHSIRSENWKLIRNQKGENSFFYELYDLVNDPQERCNLANEQQDKFEEFKRILESWEKESVSFNEKENIKPLTEEEKELVRSLGYLQ